MLLKIYTNEDFYKSRCIACNWILDALPKTLKKGVDVCPNCGKYGFTYFPSDQSAHILGGMIHFIDSYNKKITSPRHIFPPQVYLPIIFLCSNYETLLSDLVRGIMNQYGSYLGRLARLMIFEDEYDRRGNEELFKRLTGKSIQEAVQNEFPDFIQKLKEMYTVRNHVVHGKDIDNTEQALSKPNEAIDLLLASVSVFSYLTNTYVCKFTDNVDFKKILRLGKTETFNP